MSVAQHIDMPSRRLVRTARCVVLTTCSRLRQTNLAYVLWVVSHFVFLLIPILLTNILLATSQQSLILSAINRNQLAVFLVVRHRPFVTAAPGDLTPKQANLATGAVNMCTNTLAASDMAALAILTAYTAAVTGIAVVLHKRDITLKFW